MARIATRIPSGLGAAGIAAIISTAPAQAMELPAPSGCAGSTCINTPAKHPTPQPTPWGKIGLGAAGAVALAGARAGAGAATVSSRNRDQKPAPAPHTPVAG
jgi:hypothetical protein